MQVLMGLVVFVSIIAFAILLIMLPINALRKKPIKPILKLLACCFGAFVFSMVVGNALYTPEQQTAFAEQRILQQAEKEQNAKIAQAEKEAAELQRQADKAEKERVKAGQSEKERLEKEQKAKEEQAKKTAESEAIQKEQPPENSLPSIENIENQITDILVETGYSIEKASNVQEILNTLGIDSIEIYGTSGAGTPTNGLFVVSCYPNGLADRNRRFFFTTDNGVLFYAGFHDEDLYDSEKGGFLKNYNDVHVPETEISIEVYEQLRTMAESEISSYLNHPGTANFKMLSWGVGRSDNDYQIRGAVDAENAFGVEDELSFSVWFEKSGDSFTVVGVSIDGARVK